MGIAYPGGKEIVVRLLIEVIVPRDALMIDFAMKERGRCPSHLDVVSKVKKSSAEAGSDTRRSAVGCILDTVSGYSLAELMKYVKGLQPQAPLSRWQQPA